MNLSKEISITENIIHVAQEDLEFIKEHLPSVYRGRVKYIAKKQKYLKFLIEELERENLKPLKV